MHDIEGETYLVSANYHGSQNHSVSVGTGLKSIILLAI